MARTKNRELKETKIEIIPMIDTMFFLLVFFILSSIGIIKLRGINIDLPEPSSAVTPNTPKDPMAVTLTVTILGNQKVFVNKTEVTSQPLEIGPVLERELRKAQSPHQPDPSKATIIINADPSVRQGLVVTAIDQAKQVNMTNFAIATVADSTGAADTTQ